MDIFANSAILLLIIGLILLMAEVFIPSGGMILIVALVCLAGSIWCAYQTWWDEPVYWWSYIATMVVAVPSAVGGMFYIFEKTSMGKRILLEPPDLDAVTGYDDDFERLSKLVGAQGKTATLLNPGGLVVVDGQRVHCVSTGMLIDADVTVEVLRVQGNELIVRVAKEILDVVDVTLPAPSQSPLPEPVADSADPFAQPVSEDDEYPMDFDVPSA